jgi:hypothetical protein
MTKSEMVSFIDRYLTYNNSVDLNQLTDSSAFPHPPSSRDWDLLIEELVSKNHLGTHGNGNHFLASPINPKTHKQELMTYLYNSDKHKTDIKPLIKSINISKDDLCVLLHTLYAKKEINSDNLWRPNKMAESDKTIDDFEFNFWLTNDGEQLVANKYLSKSIVQHIDNSVKDSVVITQSRFENSPVDLKYQNKLVTQDPNSDTTIKSKILNFFSWIVAHPIVSGTVATVFGAIIYGLIKGEISIPF